MVAERLALPASDHDVPGSNPAEDGSLLYGASLPFKISRPLSRYDLNNVEREVNHQNIIIISALHT